MGGNVGEKILAQSFNNRSNTFKNFQKWFEQLASTFQKHVLEPMISFERVPCNQIHHFYYSFGTPPFHCNLGWGYLRLSHPRDKIGETGTSKISCGVGIPSGSTHMITVVGKLGMLFPMSACLASATKRHLQGCPTTRCAFSFNSAQPFAVSLILIVIYIL